MVLCRWPPGALGGHGDITCWTALVSSLLGRMVVGDQACVMYLRLWSIIEDLVFVGPLQLSAPEGNPLPPTRVLAQLFLSSLDL